MPYILTKAEHSAKTAKDLRIISQFKRLGLLKTPR